MTNPTRYTIDDILRLEPCWGDPGDGYSDDLARDEILKVWPVGQTTVTVHDIASTTSVQLDDRIWLLTQFMRIPQLRLFMCWCAEQHIKRILADKRDNRVIQAINAARRYVDGKVTDDELSLVHESAWLAEDDAGVVWRAGPSGNDKATVWAARIAEYATGIAVTIADSVAATVTSVSSSSFIDIAPDELVRLHEEHYV